MSKQRALVAGATGYLGGFVARWMSILESWAPDIGTHTEHRRSEERRMSDTSRSALRWLRASYITGAVVDGLIAVLMLVPSRMGESEFRYPMGLGAALMLGWTVLLLWANRRPMERKGVLLITVCPAITGLVATGIWAVASGLIPLAQALPSLTVGSSVAVLMSFSYWKAGRAERLNA